MKIKLLAILTLPFTILAQNAIDSSTTNNLGSKKQFYVCAENTPDLSLISGTGVTWDYSQAAGTGETRIVSFQSVDSTPFANDFSGFANTSLSVEGFSYNYYQKTASSLVQVGYVIPDTDLDDIKAKFFAQSWTQMQYPYVFDNNFVDSYAGDISFKLNGNNQNPNCTGSGSTHYDGFGTLIMPDGNTLGNISRIKMIDTLYTNVSLFGPVRLIRHQYEYYKLDSLGSLPLFIHTHAYLLSSFPDPLIDIKVVLSRSLPVQQVGLAEVRQTDFEIYPNPSNGTVFVKGVSDIPVRFDLYDASGRICESGILEKEMQFSQNSGVYQLHIHNASGKIQKKIVIR